jgi:hypothetical protein
MPVIHVNILEILIHLEKTHFTLNHISGTALFRNCEKRLSASTHPSVCRSVHMEELGYYGTELDEILYLSIFRRSVEKIQVSLKSDKNNGYFT